MQRKVDTEDSILEQRRLIRNNINKMPPTNTSNSGMKMNSMPVGSKKPRWADIESSDDDDTNNNNNNSMNDDDWFVDAKKPAKSPTSPVKNQSDPFGAFASKKKKGKIVGGINKEPPTNIKTSAANGSLSQPRKPHNVLESDHSNSYMVKDPKMDAELADLMGNKPPTITEQSGATTNPSLEELRAKLDMSAQNASKKKNKSHNASDLDAPMSFSGVGERFEKGEPLEKSSDRSPNSASSSDRMKDTSNSGAWGNSAGSKNDKNVDQSAFPALGFEKDSAAKKARKMASGTGNGAVTKMFIGNGSSFAENTKGAGKGVTQQSLSSGTESATTSKKGKGKSRRAEQGEGNARGAADSEAERRAEEKRKLEEALERQHAPKKTNVPAPSKIAAVERQMNRNSKSPKKAENGANWSKLVQDNLTAEEKEASAHIADNLKLQLNAAQEDSIQARSMKRTGSQAGLTPSSQAGLANKRPRGNETVDYNQRFPVGFVGFQPAPRDTIQKINFGAFKKPDNADMSDSASSNDFARGLRAGSVDSTVANTPMSVMGGTLGYTTSIASNRSGTRDMDCESDSVATINDNTSVATFDAEQQINNRRKRLNRVKESMEYKLYAKQVPKDKRKESDPGTPRLEVPQGSRQWKFELEGWRRWLCDNYGIKEEK